MPRILKENEKNRTKPLYREAFPEDSESFLSYYYTEKTEDNIIMVDEADNGDIKAMLHLNPYRVAVKQREYMLYYIVAVATAKAYRRQGLMRKLLDRTLHQSYVHQEPFIFLLPANRAYYEPFDFVFVSDYAQVEFKDEKNIQAIPYAESYADTWLKLNKECLSEYDVHIVKDRAYLERFLKELASEDGYMEMLYQDTEAVGFRAYWGSQKKELRTILVKKDIATLHFLEKPYMMARITNVYEILSALCLKKESVYEELMLQLYIQDDIIKENNGRFDWHLTKEASNVRKVEDAQGQKDLQFTMDKTTTATLSFTIGELTSIIFGRISHPAFNEIHLIQSFFIDEAV